MNVVKSYFLNLKIIIKYVIIRLDLKTDIACIIMMYKTLKKCFKTIFSIMKLMSLFSIYLHVPYFQDLLFQLIFQKMRILQSYQSSQGQIFPMFIIVSLMILCVHYSFHVTREETYPKRRIRSLLLSLLPSHQSNEW